MVLAWQEVVFGLPKIAQRLPQNVCEEQLLPLYCKLAADRVWLVRAAAASTLPAVAELLLPAGLTTRFDSLSICEIKLATRVLPPSQIQGTVRKQEVHLWTWHALVHLLSLMSFSCGAGRKQVERHAGEGRASLTHTWQSLAGDNSKWVVSSALTSLGPLLALLPAQAITDGQPLPLRGPFTCLHISRDLC